MINLWLDNDLDGIQRFGHLKSGFPLIDRIEMRYHAFSGQEATLKKIDSDFIAIGAEMRTANIELFAVADDRPVGGGFFPKHAKFNEAPQLAYHLQSLSHANRRRSLRYKRRSRIRPSWI